MGAGRAVDGEPGAEEWDALVHPGQKLKPGARMVFEGPAQGRDRRSTARSWRAGFRDAVPSGCGIRRRTCVAAPSTRSATYRCRPTSIGADRPDDRERYQTVYARARGSIAAPTAGLHFTETLLAELAARGVQRTDVTLHVGYGTFKPVRVERVEDHAVDPEVVRGVRGGRRRHSRRPAARAGA